jgi:hypothetical protein
MACLRMLPRLQAEESQLTAERLAVGTGVASADVQRAIRRNWERDRNGGLTARQKKVPASPDMLKRSGIKFEIVPKTKK